jgi:hypothetical protein
MENKIIHLNIGGQEFKIYKSTLDKLEYFKVYFERGDQKDEIYFFDFDPDSFKHILNILRYPKYAVSKDDFINVKNLLEMLNPMMDIQILSPMKVIIMKKAICLKYYADICEDDTIINLKVDDSTMVYSIILYKKNKIFRGIKCSGNSEMVFNSMGYLKSKFVDIINKERICRVEIYVNSYKSNLLCYITYV